MKQDIGIARQGLVILHHYRPKTWRVLRDECDTGKLEEWLHMGLPIAPLLTAWSKTNFPIGL